MLSLRCGVCQSGNHAGYGIVQLNEDGKTFSKTQVHMVSQPYSAQLAEIMALTAACQFTPTQRTQYGVCHVFGNFWQTASFSKSRWYDNHSWGTYTTTVDSHTLTYIFGYH